MLEVALMQKEDVIGKREDREEKITELFLTYSDEILRMCYLYLGDCHMAEDALQETFIRVIKGFGTFQGSSSEKTWIIRIAINVCKTMLANRKKENVQNIWGEEWDACSLVEKRADEIEEILQKGVVSQAVMQLEEKYREIIILHFYQELKLREIAKMTGLPMTTVAHRIRQGKRLLKKVIGEF